MLVDEQEEASPNNKRARRRLPRRVISSVVTSCQNQITSRQGRSQALTRLLISLPLLAVLCTVASWLWQGPSYSFSETRAKAWDRRDISMQDGLGAAWYLSGLVGLRLTPATVMFALMLVRTRYQASKTGTLSPEQRFLSSLLEWGWRDMLSSQPCLWQVGEAIAASIVEQLGFRVLLAYLSMTLLQLLRHVDEIHTV